MLFAPASIVSDLPPATSIFPIAKKVGLLTTKLVSTSSVLLASPAFATDAFVRVISLPELAAIFRTRAPAPTKSISPRAL